MINFLQRACLLGMIWFVCLGTLQAQVVSLSSPIEKLLDISGDTEMLVDSTGDIEWEEIQELDFSSFEEIPVFINEGIKSFEIHVWLKFRLSNQTLDQDFSFLFSTGWYDQIDLYTIDAQGELAHQSGGMHTNLNDRPYLPNPYFFPLRLSANEELQVYVRIHNTYRKRDVLLQPQLMNEAFATDYLARQSQSLKSIHGFNYAFLGALFFMFGLFLFQFFQNGDRTYFYYSAYLLGFFLYFLHRFEMYGDINFLFTRFGEYFLGLEATISMFSYIMYLQFSRSFMDMKNQLPFLDKVLKYLVYFILGYILVDIGVAYIWKNVTIGSVMYHVVRTYIIIPVVLFSIVSIIRLIRKNKLARYHSAGSIFLSLGSVIAMLSSMFFETYSTHLWDRPLTYMQIGVFLELLCFSLGLGYKTFESQREKQATQKRLISQLEKNEQLQRKLNEELEQEVNTRTSEILEKSKLLEKEEAEKLAAEYSQRLAEVELKSLQGQMNPHFLFNSLNSIKHFILTNDKFTAADYLTNFSKLVRLILNNSKQKTITLKEELETLVLYLEMEKMRFPKKFSFEIKLAENIIPENYDIPPLILQPYVENAIWHGLMHKKKGLSGKIKIEIHAKGDCLFFIIEDNGIGRKKAMEIKSKSGANRKSYGMQITHDRLTLTDQNSDIQIIDLQSENGEARGTRVELKLPV